MIFLKGKIAIIGDNEVQKSLQKRLEVKGFTTASFNSLSDFSEYDNNRASFEKVFLPFPSNEKNCGKASSDKLIFTEKQSVFGGLFDEKTRYSAEKSGAEICDYFEDEAYVLKNAILTSYGAVRLLLENTKTSITGKKALITGFGRIGSSLALMLRGLGLKVYVAARRKEICVRASSMGFDVIKFSQLKGALFYFDFIFNTVPEKILTCVDVTHLRNDTLYFELSSFPFGASKEDFIENGKLFIDGKALPGRFFPEAVAENIVDYLLERGEG